MFLSQLGPDQRDSAISQLGTEQFDILVIGGGVTGVGAALDAASRGLKVALIDSQDIASGTSSTIPAQTITTTNGYAMNCGIG